MKSVVTTHMFNNNDRCSGCGLMFKNVIKRPTCKTLMNGSKTLIKVDAFKNPISLHPDFPREDAKKTAHVFKDGWCQFCDVRDYEEYKSPWCEKIYKTPMGGTSGSSKGGVLTQCHLKHPVLKFGELEIYGGSCIDPKVKDCDVYIGFDQGMKLTKKSMPWRRGVKGYAEEVFHHVQDFHAPKDAKEFVSLVEWTLKQMKEGKKVHAGCIGGHGRTGTFFAALAAMQTEVVIKDCIMYVREHYCKKAVECAEQIKFLKKHFGVVTKATGSKSFMMQSGTKKSASYSMKKQGEFSDPLPDEDDEDDWTATPKPRQGNVWGRTLDDESL